MSGVGRMWRGFGRVGVVGVVSVGVVAGLLTGCSVSSSQVVGDSSSGSVSADPAGVVVSDVLVSVVSSAGGGPVAFFMGSLAGDSGAGELVAADGGARLGVAAFTRQGSDPVRVVAGGYDLSLSFGSDGRVTGSGVVHTAGAGAGAVSDVTAAGEVSSRLREASQVAGVCGVLDETALTLGKPSGAVVDALGSVMKLDPVADDDPLQTVLARWDGLDALVVNGGSLAALSSDVVPLFLNGSKWVVITDPQAADESVLGKLLPWSSGQIMRESAAVAIRSTDPGASWNENYQVVPLDKSTKGNPGVDVKAFIADIQRDGDNCYTQNTTTTDANTATATTNPQPATTSQSSAGANSLNIITADLNGEAHVRTIAAPASTTDGPSSSVPSLPPRTYGFSVGVIDHEEHTIEGGFNKARFSPQIVCSEGSVVVDKHAATDLPRVRTVIKSCPRAGKQEAELAVEDVVWALLNITGYKREANGVDATEKDVDLQWQVSHFQSATVNATTNRNASSRKLSLAFDGTNGSIVAERLGSGGWQPVTEYPLGEIAWILVRAQTDIELGATAAGTNPFVFRADQSYPLKAVENGSVSKSVGVTTTIGGDIGTFSTEVLGNVSYSKSTSVGTDVSVSVPDWVAKPSVDNRRAVIAWETNRASADKKATFKQYLQGKDIPMEHNPLNVSGLQQRSVYTWQSDCMFGKVPVSIRRSMEFADVYETVSDFGWANPAEIFNPKVKSDVSSVVTPPWVVERKINLDFNDSRVSVYPKRITSATGYKDERPIIYNMPGCSKYPEPAAGSGSAK